MEERESQARRTVNKYIGFSAGVGLLPLPFINTAGITALQLRMLQVLSEAYDVPFSRDLGKKIIGSLLGSIVPTSLSGTLGGVASLFASSAQVAQVAGSIVGRLIDAGVRWGFDIRHRASVYPAFRIRWYVPRF